MYDACVRIASRLLGGVEESASLAICYIVALATTAQKLQAKRFASLLLIMGCFVIPALKNAAAYGQHLFS